MSPEKGGEEKKNTHCTEKQLQMVLHPSSLCHKPNCTAPHHTAPPPLTQPTPEARLTHLVLPGWTVFFLRHSRCVYRFITASPVSAQSTPAPHTACLNFFFYLLYLCCQLIALATSLVVSDWQTFFFFLTPKG